jgi:hypothetical protein
MELKKIILIAAVLTYLALWLLHAGKTTFVLLRSEKTYREKEIYTKASVIHTYFNVFLWVLFIVIVMLKEFVGLNRGLAGAIIHGLASLIVIGIPLAAVAGLFFQKSEAGKLLCIIFFPIVVIIVFCFLS